LANFFSKKIKGEEHRSQLQPVVFNDENTSVASLKKSQLDSYDELESYKRLRKKRIKIACIRMAVWLFVIFLLPIFVFFSIVIINPKAGHNLFGYTFYIVSSHSMEPVFFKDDCIVVKRVNSVDEIEIGSDITFIRTSDGETVTHRVIEIITNENGDVEYITRGVHNSTADSGTVAFENVLGVRIKTVSWIGNLVSYFRTPYGIVTFLAIFAFIMMGINFAFRMSDDIRAVGFK